MSKTKAFWNKKRLALAAVGLVVVIAAVIAAVALLTGSREMCFRDISDLDPASEPVLQVQNGPSQIPSPFPRYSVTGPEGYTQTQDSSLTANRYSREYQDRFYTQEGAYVDFSQTPVLDQDRIVLSAQAEYEILRFGEMEVVYCQSVDWQNQDLVELIWLKDHTKFSVTSNQTLDRDQALEWITWVDLEHPAAPETKPLEILPGKVWTFTGETGTVTDNRPWQVVGNPDLPESRSSHTFLTLPDGFAPGSSSGMSNGFETWVYQRENGDRMYLTNPTISSYSCTLFQLSEQELADPNAVEQVTVKGHSGVMRLGEKQSVLVWLVEDGYVELGYDGAITARELLALGEQVS